MSSHHPDQAVFRSVLPEDIDWQPFPAFPPSARLAVVVGQPSEPAPYVVRVKVPAGLRLGQPASGVTIPYSRMRR
jgi:hypothetical protein